MPSHILELQFSGVALFRDSFDVIVRAFGGRFGVRGHLGQNPWRLRARRSLLWVDTSPLRDAEPRQPHEPLPRVRGALRSSPPPLPSGAICFSVRHNDNRPLRSSPPSGVGANNCQSASSVRLYVHPNRRDGNADLRRTGGSVRDTGKSRPANRRACDDKCSANSGSCRQATWLHLPSERISLLRRNNVPKPRLVPRHCNLIHVAVASRRTKSTAKTKRNPDHACFPAGRRQAARHASVHLSEALLVLCVQLSGMRKEILKMDNAIQTLLDFGRPSRHRRGDLHSSGRRTSKALISRRQTGGAA